MKLRPEQLAVHLQQVKSLAPFYWISSDIPLLNEELCQQLITAAQQRDFQECLKWQIDAQFNWESFYAETRSVSLFAEKKLLVLHDVNSKVSAHAGQTLAQYAQAASNDVIVILISPKLESATQKTPWFKQLEEHSVLIQVWPIPTAQWPMWLKKRAQVQGIQFTPEALMLFAQATDGNVVAACNVLQQLALLSPPDSQNICDVAQLSALLHDQSHYDIFSLIDAVMLCDHAIVAKQFARLYETAVEPVLVLWALHRCLSWALLQQQQQPIADIWPQKKPLLAKFAQQHASAQLTQWLQQAALLDKQIKGFCAGDPWAGLSELALAMSTPHPRYARPLPQRER